MAGSRVSAFRKTSLPAAAGRLDTGPQIRLLEQASRPREWLLESSLFLNVSARFLWSSSDESMAVALLQTGVAVAEQEDATYVSDAWSGETRYRLVCPPTHTCTLAKV